MSLYLQVDTNEAYDFFVIYDRLSPLRQKIWNKIAQKCRSWTNVMPSQSKIAEWCGCSRSAVSEALKIFKEQGWLSLESRGFKRSKRIFMPQSKQSMDVTNRQWFKRVEATYRATHTYSTYKNITSTAGEISKIPLNLPKLSEKLGYSYDSSLKLSLLPEHILEETLYKCKKLGSTGFRPENEERYFVGMAINMALDKGHKINWRKYYDNK